MFLRIVLKIFSPWAIEIKRFKKIINNRPQTILIIIAEFKENNKNGIIKDNAKINFPIKTLIADLSACFFVVPLSEIFREYTPKESDKESAIAILKIPPITASLEAVAPINPTMTPRVVKTPEEMPYANLPNTS